MFGCADNTCLPYYVNVFTFRLKSTILDNFLILIWWDWLVIALKMNTAFSSMSLCPVEVWRTTCSGVSYYSFPVFSLILNNGRSLFNIGNIIETGGSYFQPLSWSLRLKVALDAAKGLAFLHSSETKVIYRDFKTSNILLDSVCKPLVFNFRS
jgi:hypothetical protein